VPAAKALPANKKIDRTAVKNRVNLFMAHLLSAMNGSFCQVKSSSGSPEIIAKNHSSGLKITIPFALAMSGFSRGPVYEAD
jgi:hypothetical protein